MCPVYCQTRPHHNQKHANRALRQVDLWQAQMPCHHMMLGTVLKAWRHSFTSHSM